MAITCNDVFSKPQSRLSSDERYKLAVDDWISNPNAPKKNIEEIKSYVLGTTQDICEAINSISTNKKVKVPDALTAGQIARIIEYYKHVALIACDKNGSSNFTLLGMYMESGPKAGTYDTSETAFDSLTNKFYREADDAFRKKVRGIIRLDLEKTQRCVDPNLIPLGNGVFNYRTKQLEPYSPDRIFLSKSPVNYNPNAQNVIIHSPDDNTDWDVESWMQELSNDPAIVRLLWEVLGAIIRPFVRWDKSAWLYSTSGNSGKGTLCELMRNLLGEGSYASIALSDFSKDFQLEPLIGANAIIVDENDVGIYLDKVANLKAIITNDVVLINRKGRVPVDYQFRGLMVQCLNEYPRIRDTSESFYRRQLFIPFDKCFTGRARKYIKDDYLSRPEVLEYVLFKVLNMDYYELSEPDSCKLVLADYKAYNNPVQSFVEEMLPETVWGILPFGFVYDLYKAWFAENNPSGKCQGRNTFIKELVDMVDAGKVPGFTCPGHKVPIRPKRLMDDPEPLILQYNLVKWMNPNYTGNDKRQICTTAPKATYNGLVRVEYEDEVALPPSTVQADAATRQAMSDICNEISEEDKNT